MEQVTLVSRRKEIIRLITVLLAALLMAVNIKTFVRTGGLYPGGATGLSILIQRILESRFALSIPYTAINVMLNAIPVYIGFRFIGRRFTLYSLVVIITSSVLTDLVPSYPLTYDTLLIAVFGGLINGLAVSMCLTVDATSGGTDFISIYLSQRRGVDSFNIILGFNVIILAAAGLMYGWDKAFYSIIFQFVSTQALHLLYRGYQQVTLFVVTERPEEVCAAIYEISHHGATILDAKGSYHHESHQLVYSVIDVPDSRRVIKAIREIDASVFINCVRTSELSGNFYFSPKN